MTTSTFSDPGRLIRLSSNESSYGCSPRATEAFVGQQEALHRYPDGGQTALREAIADVYNLPAASIVCGNGSEELIGLCVRKFLNGGDEVVLTHNHFVMCPIYVEAQGADIVLAAEKADLINVDSILGAMTERTRMVIVANPNNPTGTCINADELARLVAGVPDTVMLILDGAYAEFVTSDDYDDGLGYATTRENIVVTHSFSKIYGLAGLRIGWACAGQSVIEGINSLRTPFNANSAAMAAASAAVKDQEFVARVREANREELDWLVPSIRSLGFAVSESVANFYLLNVENMEGATAESLVAWLEADGILPRPSGNDGDQVRITIGLRSENEAVLQSLEAYLGALK